MGSSQSAVQTNNDKDLEIKVEKSKEKFKSNWENLKATYSSSPLETPCFRSTMLTALPSGMIGSLLVFLLTSNSKRAVWTFTGTFLVVSNVYFKLCYDEFQERIKENKEVNELMQMLVKYRGTEIEEKLKIKYKEKLEEIDKKAKFV